jgi:hypothetical protein
MLATLIVMNTEVEGIVGVVVLRCREKPEHSTVAQAPLVLATNNLPVPVHPQCLQVDINLLALNLELVVQDVAVDAMYRHQTPACVFHYQPNSRIFQNIILNYKILYVFNNFEFN